MLSVRAAPPSARLTATPATAPAAALMVVWMLMEALTAPATALVMMVTLAAAAAAGLTPLQMSLERGQVAIFRSAAQRPEHPQHLFITSRRRHQAIIQAGILYLGLNSNPVGFFQRGGRG